MNTFFDVDLMGKLSVVLSLFLSLFNFVLLVFLVSVFNGYRKDKKKV